MDRCTFIVAISMLCGTCIALNTLEIPRDNLLNHVTRDLDQDWLKYKTTFNKTYESVNEELTRRLNWEDTVRYIREHNAGYQAGKYSFPVAENQFADMDEDEFREKYLVTFDHDVGSTKAEARSTKGSLSGSCLPGEMPWKLPKSIDWRGSGYVTSVKNQKPCEACWAFATAAALEGLYKNISEELKDLSVQNLIDCTISDYNCSVGIPNISIPFEFVVHQQKGIDLASCYGLNDPVNVSASCRYNESCSVLTEPNWTYSLVEQWDECALKLAVATRGPVAASIDANHTSFRHYHADSPDDVYYNENCTLDYNHAVTVVGYGTSNIGGDYWIVKNSWGTQWGDKGYGYMARNRDNNCEIASDAVYPCLTKDPDCGVVEDVLVDTETLKFIPSEA